MLSYTYLLHHTNFVATKEKATDIVMNPIKLKKASREYALSSSSVRNEEKICRKL